MDTVLQIVFLIVALLLILGSAELFTNGVEWLGQRLQLSEGVVGSVLAAVGTALPETLIPVVAVLMFKGEEATASAEVGIGAIAGAPFMLSTLTLSLCGWAIWFFATKGRRQPQVKINRVVIARDLAFFMPAYGLGLLASIFDPWPVMRWIVVGLLCLNYLLYLQKSFSHEGEVGEAPEHLHIDKALKAGTGVTPIIIQVLIGLGGIVGGAYLFVDHVQHLSHLIGIPEVILSLIIAPVATELPEKINSVLWARQCKYTLALGNITGALVFQSCFPVAFGVAFTPWDLGPGVVVSGIVAILSALMFYILIRTDKLTPKLLMLGAIAYLGTIGWMLATNQSH